MYGNSGTMLLTELIGVKKYYDLTLGEIMSKLAKHYGGEWTSGTYGAVLINPNWNYVIKVFQNDPYYLDFINFILAHPNPHFPKVQRKPIKMHSFFTRTAIEPSVFYVVKIEKLQPISKELGRFIVKYLEVGTTAAYRLYHMPPEQRKQSIQLYGDYDAIDKRAWVLPDGSVHKLSVKELFEKLPWFKSLCNAMWMIWDNVEGSSDIHAGNFMQRKDGTIVITDPLWEGSDPMKDYYEYMRRETDYYANLDIKSGPDYLRKNKRPPPQPHDWGVNNPGEDDIPF